MAKKHVSVRHELREMSEALEAARLLCDCLRTRSLPERDDALQAHQSVSAIVAMVASRMRQLAKVIGGEADAATIIGPHNEATADTAAPDLLLPVGQRAGRRVTAGSR